MREAAKRAHLLHKRAQLLQNQADLPQVANVPDLYANVPHESNPTGHICNYGHM